MDKVETAQELIQNFINTLHPYDYYAIYWLGAVLFFLIVLIILLRAKEGLAAFLMLIFMSIFFFGFVGTYFLIHKYLYGTTYKIDYIKQMKFANVLVLKGTLTSSGEENITDCKLHTFITPPQDGFMKNLQFLYAIKPLKKDTFIISENLEKGQSTEFKMKFLNFKYSKDINSSDIYIYRECFNKKYFNLKGE
jgi:hypothetical protein